MSRIGRAPVAVPAAITVTQEGHRLLAEGPKGKVSIPIPEEVTVTVSGQSVSVARRSDEPSVKALHGLTRALIANMVQGVANGFQKELEVVGIGYRAQAQGKHLTLQVGFSHPVLIEIPDGLTVETPKPTQILVKGADKYLVGQFAANVRRIAPPEPYKGKGIRYAGEVVRRKAGKAATGAGAKAAA